MLQQFPNRCHPPTTRCEDRILWKFSFTIKLHVLFPIFCSRPVRHLYILAKDLLGAFEKETNISTRIFSTFPGAQLEGLMYRSTMFNDLAHPLLDAKHVTTTKGTGLVHTSYAHGLDDFRVNFHFLKNFAIISGLISSRPAMSVCFCLHAYWDWVVARLS